MTYSGYFPADTVDETADATDMQGPSSSWNQLAGRSSIASDPTKSMVVLWFVCLALIWFLGWFFRGHRK